MKRIAGLIALVGILAVGSWLTLRGHEACERAGTTTVAPSPEAQADPTLVDAGSPAVPLATSVAPTPVVVEAASVPAARTAVATAYEDELARAIWVEGRVVFPPGTPAD